LEAITGIEVIAVFLALVYLVLAAYQNSWCWLAAAISSVLYIKICFDAKLFIETGLQFFYLIMAIVGYFQWQKQNPTLKDDQQIINLSFKSWIQAILICSIISFVMAFWFQQNTNAKLPWLDAPVTVFSVWATWLVIKKVLQNWLLWIVIDSVAIYIYTQRALHITALLYALYTMLAIIGYFKWKKAQQISLK
jgi:nicotinamide mononucleotide transporter